MSDLRKPLELKMLYSMLNHMGISMYHKPVDVISEIIANAWDADATVVDIKIDKKNNAFCVSDNGVGMTYEECQNHYLSAGRDRRLDLSTDVTPTLKRKVLGRKGIGKFSGFGVAETIEVATCSKESNERIAFTLDIKGIDPSASIDEFNVVASSDYREMDENDSHGTTIFLKGCREGFVDSASKTLRRGLARRFVLDALLDPDDSFVIKVNGTPIENGFESGRFEFEYPRDLPDEDLKRFSVSEVGDDGWGLSIVDGREISWRVGFTKETIGEPELQGISVFARGKLAQAPFFFEHSGGSASEFAAAYLTGQMRMDFVDEGDMDLISPERQRIDFDDPRMLKIKAWGSSLVDGLSRKRKDSRTERRERMLYDSDGKLGQRISALGPTERRQVTSLLKKMAGFANLGRDRFEDWGGQIISAYEKGRLYEMLEELSGDDEFEDDKLLEMVREAGMLTDLQVGEAIKTKILVIAELKRRVENKDLENRTRDFIAEHPWLIDPKLETAQKEISLLKTLKEELGTKDLDYEADEIYCGRIDLLLKQGAEYTLVEFMRPGLPLDYDHVNRLERYAVELSTRMNQNSGITLRKSLVIAECSSNPAVVQLMKNKEEGNPTMTFRTWAQFLDDCKGQFYDHIEVYKRRNPDDERIQAL